MRKRHLDQALAETPDGGLVGDVVFDGEPGEADEGEASQKGLLNGRIAELAPPLEQQDLEHGR